MKERLINNNSKEKIEKKVKQTLLGGTLERNLGTCTKENIFNYFQLPKQIKDTV